MIPGSERRAWKGGDNWELSRTAHMKIEVQTLLSEYEEIVKTFTDNNEATIPLCAAEPIVSDLVESALSSQFSTRYIKSAINSFDPSQEFIGSQYIYPLYQLISKICRKLYDAEYADPRPLSGMNAAISTLMALTDAGDKVLLLHPDAGGHESFPEICKRLSLNVDDVPFDYLTVEYDIQKINTLLASNEYRAIIIPPSDLIAPPPIAQLEVPNDVIVLYDCTQSFGFIAAGIHPNPLQSGKKVVLLGGTHKTIAGPTCGLVLCNDTRLAAVLEGQITPVYVRNPHPHHIASLTLALIEFIETGSSFMSRILDNANILGKLLEERGFSVIKTAPPPTAYTLTHQILLSLDFATMERIEKNARRLNISLDTKNKKIYGKAGIRLGLQAVTRLGWKQADLKKLADLLAMMRQGLTVNELVPLANELRGKDSVMFTIRSSEHGFQDI